MSIDHRAAVERLLEVASEEKLRNEGDPTFVVAVAQVHATLARNEEQTARTADMQEALHSLRRRFSDTRTLVAQHIASGLASREKDRWKAAVELSKALDEAHNNVDDLVDARLSDDGWDPRSAYKTPASLVPSDDPWSAKPDIAAQVPEPVRRVLVEYLAAALLSKGDAQGVAQTITFALKHAGADLTSDIEKQVSDIALGRDPSDPPF